MARPPLQYQYEQVTPPRSPADLPRYLGELLGGFFGRLFYIIQLVWESGPAFLLLMALVTLFEGLMPLVGALLSREILNSLQGVITRSALGEVFTLEVFWGSMVLLLLIFFFIYKILNKIVGRIKTAVARIAGERVVRQVKVRIMEKAKTLDIASFDMPAFYEKLENANREAGTRPVTILNSTFSIISAFISLVGYVVILASALPLAAVVIILMAIPSALINFIYRRKMVNYVRVRSVDRRQMNYFSDLMVNKDMAKEIRLLGLGDTLMERYDSVFARYYKGLKRLVVKENLWQATFAVLSALVNCAFFAYIAFGVFRGQYMIGDYSLYTDALGSIATAVGTLITTSATVYEGTLFIDNLISFLGEKQHVVPTVTPPAMPAKGTAHTIEFCDVSFTYPGSSAPVLSHINLTIRPGENMALVGLNGAGKTTLIKLLTRLYDPTEGKILLDGRDLREYDVATLHSLFGIVFQDFGKYAVSVGENISFGSIGTEPTAERLARAAKCADATAFIERLPNGYDTQLMRYFDRDGTELSGGQWQKLAVARAFFGSADILILDEPTAALDALAEQEIFNQFDELRRDKTTVFVSHRLSSVVNASKIVVLENGRIVEEGTHRKLLAANGRYALLFTTQAKRYMAKNT